MKVKSSETSAGQFHLTPVFGKLSLERLLPNFKLLNWNADNGNAISG
ncbi:MAG: hypothetical protein ACR2N3_05555 [Pyrinomonadaceae bacterium]